MKSVFKKVLGGALAMLPTAAVANPACPICTIAIGAGVGRGAADVAGVLDD